MQVMRIEPGAVGAWEIETFADSPYRLSVPLDGRATVTELAGGFLDVDAQPAELLAWGRFDPMSGLGQGVAVGESLVLVFAEHEANRDFVARVTPIVVHILEDRGLPDSG